MEAYCVKEKRRPNVLNQVEIKHSKMKGKCSGAPVLLVELKNTDFVSSKGK